MDKPTNKSPFFALENLECWQQAKHLAVELYRVSGRGNLEQDLFLRDQLRRCALSIASQIAGGKERGSASEFLAHLGTARAAAAELRTQLAVCREIGYLSEGDFLDLEDRITRISAMISGLARAIRRRRDGVPPAGDSPEKEEVLPAT